MTAAAPPARPRLSIAVIGLGGIGSTFAFRLARAGHEVTAIARPGSLRLAQLTRDGGVVTKAGERAAMGVSGQLDEQIAYDLVLVTTLAHQVEAVLPALGRSRAGHIQFMFNTFDPERLRDAAGERRCSFGMPFVAATLDSQGGLDSQVGAARKTLHGERQWADLFSKAGVPSAFEPRMELWLRCHAPMCVAMESIAVAAKRRGAGASWAEAMVVARGLRGGFAIVSGLGERLYPGGKRLLNAAPTPVTAALLWGLSRAAAFRELLATGIGECRALADVMAAAGGETPGLAAAVSAVLAMKPEGAG